MNRLIRGEPETQLISEVSAITNERRHR